MSEGLFIAFEGGEGSGKSTAARTVAASLEAADVRVILTREPGGTVAGEKVRRLLGERLVPWAETYAFLAARAQLVEEVIRPALASGATVVCDRYQASTFAYQGWGRGLALEDLRQANARATGGLAPDLTLFLDIDPEAGLRRKHGEKEMIATGAAALDFHRRVREGYLAQADEARAGSWVRIDAGQPVERVTAEAIRAVRERMRE